MGRRLLQVATGVVLGLVTVFVLLPLLSRRPPPDDPHVLPGPWPAPTARLTDHRGREVELPGDFEGVTVVFFGYTSCPDVCPLTLAELARVADRLPADLARRFRTVLVTVDPARDTPERLADYLARFDTSFVGLTGTEEELEQVASAWGAWAERAGTVPGAGDAPDSDPNQPDSAPSPEGHQDHGGAVDPDAPGYLVDHTTRAFVVDARGRVVATFPGSTPAEVMTPTLTRFLEEGGR
ncbi:MAG TPA: SCO family protein [Longimicrobiales bacterium]|nr:SCO family protein [Longimicrobiales bacterium]